ncbi:hypothetical protein B0F90DRAFT_1674737 [Multifurca ochricompacta]|uniref:Chromo domain-containing protein n=1 Tax=Multifurca ochricompacta TaxID=376703 RepID=A0AAD4QRE8_9AGAM|nr:hypothetical protein B0F90DRAFT_1674737 [Multifurca ochricompacta]
MPRKRALSSSDEDVYHVEVITSARVNEDAEWEYLVSWAGYSSEEDSWEPAENVEQCDRLLRSFWRHIGMDDEDYSPGDQFDAHPWWIKQEREYFAKMWSNKVKKKKKSSRDRHYSFTISSTGPKKVKRDQYNTLQEFVRQQNNSQSDDSTNDSDEIPLRRPHAAKSSGGMSPIRHRKGSKPRNASDSHEEELFQTDDEISLEGRRAGGASSSKVTAARLPRPVLKSKRRRLLSPDSARDRNAAVVSSSKPPRKFVKTSTFSELATSTVPATPTRGSSGDNHSPSSLFSAPSSPAPIPSSYSAPQPSSPPMPAPLAHVPPPKPPPPRSTNSTNVQSKAARKPRWLLEPKIKRFNDPNLKPSSTLPTKAGLFGAAKALETSQPSTSDKRDSTQGPNEPSTSRPSFTTEVTPGLVSSSSADLRNRDPALQLTDIQAPSGKDVSRLPPVSMRETDIFLRDLMPPEMSEPMVDGAEPNRPPPARRLSTADFLKNTSIPRKFKWSGELRINTEKDHKERVCNVAFSEPSEGSLDRLRFSICFNPSVSFLLLEKLLSLGELQSLRPALTPVSETARLGPENEVDVQPLNTLFFYMSSRKLVSYSAIRIDGNQVALLLVFPATNLILCKEYNVRPELRKAGHFIAALLPWKVVGIKARAHRLYRDPCERTHRIFRSNKEEYATMAERERSLRKEPSYHRALSILGFPKWLHDDMSSQPDSMYCFWNKDGDGGQTEYGFETRALKLILDKCRAKDVGLKADVSVVFVHVGAIRTLSALPALMERRMKRPDVQFVTYGTHHSVPPARWGMRPIYPAGGIATVSPTVLAESPLTAYRLLDMFEQHPLWDCFVTPGVVALMARQNRGSDPITEFERGTLIHQELLSRIGQGQLSLVLVKPPQYGSKEEPILKWIRGHQQVSMLEPRGVLEYCLHSFSEQFSEYPEEEWTGRVIEDLSSTMSSLQIQPSIMDEYRRFTIIVGKKDNIAPDRGIFEWTLIDSFNLRDDYFSKQKLDDLRSWASVELEN